MLLLKRLSVLSGGALLALGGCGMQGDEGDEGIVEPVGSALEAAKNPAGIAETVHTSGAIDRTNPFFLAMGTNPRTCETCHSAAGGWTITADAMKRLFQQSQGLDPAFNLVDTGNSPNADVSTLEARRATFDLMIKRAVIRFTRTISPTAQFIVASVVDPSGFSDSTKVLSFRRPSPTANESKIPNTGWAGGPAAAGVAAAVQATAGGATRLHEQRVDALPVPVAEAERDFMMGVIFAQSVDRKAGPLDADGAMGGPTNLMAQVFYPGINDIQGLDPMGHPFTRKVFNLFDAWKDADDCDHDHGHGHNEARDKARASIYRGQEIFNSYEFDITGVAGLNDLLGQTTVRGTCSTCHNSPNVGAHSVFRQFDIDTANPENCGEGMVLVTLQNKTTGATRTVCDMGRATGSGLWADIGKFTAPRLRGLAARAPYFHDGQAKDIEAVVRYYNKRFNMHLNGHEKKDLEAFLGAL
jgi:hypothetical protein